MRARQDFFYLEEGGLRVRSAFDIHEPVSMIYEGVDQAGILPIGQDLVLRPGPVDVRSQSGEKHCFEATVRIEAAAQLGAAALRLSYALDKVEVWAL